MTWNNDSSLSIVTEGQTLHYVVAGRRSALSSLQPVNTESSSDWQFRQNFVKTTKQEPFSNMSAPLQFLVGTNSDSISLVAFDPSAKSLKTVKTTKGFTTPSWIEPSANKALKGKVYYAVSEESKKVLSLELQSDGSVKETGSAPTNGNCAHGESRDSADRHRL